MRLTLRTLLAYLDDTLEPAQTKDIGQKIAESPAAQELVARIKEVVRRRRLTTPPVTGPGAKLDANTVAEYIDSTLPPEQLMEVEDICFNSDVHLAEIAACHQILTLILSEPALVPPTARQRMYGLVRGREAIPFRKPAPSPTTNGAEETPEGREADEALLLGLPSYTGQGASLRRVLPLVAVVLLGAALAIAIWQALPSLNPGRPVRDVPVAQKPVEPEKAVESSTASSAGESKPAHQAESPSETVKPAPSPESKPREPAPASTAPPSAPKPAAEPTSETIPPAPEAIRKPVGRYVVEALPTILLGRRTETDPWERMVRDTPVSSSDQLVSLPGYRSEIRLDKGVHLVLWGDVPDGSSPVLMLESSVVLHDSPDVDLDLTLETGRVSFSNHKAEAPARVRVRFNDQVWELVLLESRTEVAMELLASPAVGFSKDSAKSLPPVAGLGLFMIQGQANLKVRYDTYLLREPNGPGRVIWNNIVGVQGPHTIQKDQLPPWARRLPPRGREAQAMSAAEERLANRMTGKGSVDLVLQETLREPDAASRILAVYSFGAANDISHLLNALADEKHADVRIAAITALRHWIARRPGQDQRVYEALKQKYKSSLAEIIMELLHPFSEKQKQQPETYETLIAYLNQDKLPIRELAYSHLIALVPQGLKIPYDPVGSTDRREYSYQEWKKLIPQGKLPPSPSQQPAGAAPGSSDRRGSRR